MQNDFREKYINDQYMNIELRDHIKKALEEWIRMKVRWKEGSKKLYQERFNEAIWNKSFLWLTQ
jgi:hypothetical protein